MENKQIAIILKHLAKAFEQAAQEIQEIHNLNGWVEPASQAPATREEVVYQVAPQALPTAEKTVAEMISEMRKHTNVMLNDDNLVKKGAQKQITELLAAHGCSKYSELERRNISVVQDAYSAFGALEKQLRS
jgi:hypothetical protein